MRNRLLPPALTFLGYLICVCPLFISPNNVMPYLGVCWIIGISLHLIASGIFFFQKYSIWKKLVYFLLPIPLGFYMSLGMILFANHAFGWWH